MDFEDKLSQQQHRNEAATATRWKNHELALQIKPQIRKQTKQCIIALKQIPKTPSGWGYSGTLAMRWITCAMFRLKQVMLLFFVNPYSDFYSCMSALLLDISTFRKLDPTDLLEHCPSCGTGLA